jgi:hypothetical protein
MDADPQKNARQACRLAVVRAAAGDVAGGVREWTEIASRITASAARDLAEEANETLSALAALPAFADGRLSPMHDAVRRHLSAM